jgi:hypothetical protein
VLRNPIDKVAVETSGVRRDDLLAKEPAPQPVPTPAVQRQWPKVKTAALAQPPAKPSTVTVEVIRGVQKANSEF